MILYSAGTVAASFRARTVAASFRRLAPPARRFSGGEPAHPFSDPSPFRGGGKSDSRLKPDGAGRPMNGPGLWFVRPLPAAEAAGSGAASPLKRAGQIGPVIRWQGQALSQSARSQSASSRPACPGTPFDGPYGSESRRPPSVFRGGPTRTTQVYPDDEREVVKRDGVRLCHVVAGDRPISRLQIFMPPQSRLGEGNQRTWDFRVPPQAGAWGYFRAPSGLQIV